MEGVFLKRGCYTPALEDDKKWSFTPLAKTGDKVRAGDWLGNVKENWLDHKIMVPFKFEGDYIVEKVADAGEYTIWILLQYLKTIKATVITSQCGNIGLSKWLYEPIRINRVLLL